MATSGKLTKQLIGADVEFWGYDGHFYAARVENVRRGIVTISYRVQGIAERIVARLPFADARQRMIVQL